MISKNDCILLLTDLQENGVDVSTHLMKLVNSAEPSIEVIKFINDNRQLDLSKFYEKLRKSYNAKKSVLYKNIVKEIDDTNDVLTTLSAMMTQILLFAKNVDDREMFLRHSRALDISRILTKYFQTYDLTNCVKLLRIIKADLKALESMKS